MDLTFAAKMLNTRSFFFHQVEDYLQTNKECNTAIDNLIIITTAEIKAIAVVLNRKTLKKMDERKATRISRS